MRRKLPSSQTTAYKTGQRLWRTGGAHSVVAGHESTVRKWCAEQHLAQDEITDVIRGWRDAHGVEEILS